MKIGILTFHCAHNYGAVLQAYALQEKLIQNGYEVEVIDYRPWYLTEYYKIFSLKLFWKYRFFGSIKYSIRTMLKFKAKYNKRKKFNKFIDTYFNLSKNTYKNYDKLKKARGYDIIIVGSDQIWNIDITDNIDKSYFGIFDNRDEIKKVISYAASMKNSNITEHNRDEYITYLQNINHISVRENNIKELLSTLIQKKISVTVDPTLLLNFEAWNLLVRPVTISKKYVLVYEVRKNPNTLMIAQHIANQIDAVVIEIESSISFSYKKRKKQSASPEEFLSYIKNASCIITTSYHATIFSLIFNRPFYTISLDDGSDNRSETILASSGLRDRMIHFSERPNFSKIKYDEANILIDTMRKESEDFLLKSINNK